MSVTLPPELPGWVKAKVDGGFYASEDEVVPEALRLLERNDRLEAERVDELRRAWREGVESGDAGALDLAKYAPRLTGG
jgi:antitoxin ParD1/3/4